MDLHLVSFKTCPYVQRSVITLKEKDVPFEITYIDLADPPAWFHEKSPLGKVPILLTTQDGTERVLFESAVINEYVDEVTPGQLMPADPWQKAQARAWIEFGSQCLMDYYHAVMAPDQAAFEEHRDALVQKLGRLQDRLEGPFFLGDSFTLADAALAPLLMRLEELDKAGLGFEFSGFPRLREYMGRLGGSSSIQQSLVPEWRELLRRDVKRSGSYVGQQMVEA